MGLRIPEVGSMDRVNVVPDVPFKLARQIEEDLQDQRLMEMVTIVMTWAKSRGISLDKLEGCVLGHHKEQERREE